MKNICVFCGSSTGSDPFFAEAAEKLGIILVQSGYNLVYGGAGVGLMGILADTVISQGGNAYGVIPSFFSKKEIAHKNLTELVFVDSMHERKLKLSEISDGFIGMPGAYGTMDEFFEVLTWSQLDLHQKPIGLLNIKGYFDPLIEFFGLMVRENFLKPEHRQMVLHSDDSAALLKMMEEYRPIRMEKWLNKIKA